MTGKQLRAARRKMKLTQVELAERLGVSSNTIARWERGEVYPAGLLLDLSMERLRERVRKR